MENRKFVLTMVYSFYTHYGIGICMNYLVFFIQMFSYSFWTHEIRDCAHLHVSVSAFPLYLNVIWTRFFLELKYAIQINNALFLCFKVLKNHGASAGASMSHSHSPSQIMPILIIPPSVSAWLDTAKEYFDKTGKCSLCIVHMEKLLIDESTHFISVVPFATTFTFWDMDHSWDHSSHFHERSCK